jgi:hypothetical protein
VLLLRDGVAVGGGAFMRHDERTAELKRVWTHADLRRQGLASKVLLELEAQVLRQGYERICLTTGFRQPEAVGLYLGHGYTALFDDAADPETPRKLPFEKAAWARRAHHGQRRSRPAGRGGAAMNTTVLDAGAEPRDPAPTFACRHRHRARARAPQPRSAPAKGDYSHLRVVPARYPARTVGTVFAVLVIGIVLHSTLTNPRWGWGVFAEWFFAEPVLEGLGRTLLLTALGAVLGFSSAPGWRWRGCRARRCWRGCRGCSPGSSGRSR